MLSPRSFPALLPFLALALALASVTLGCASADDGAPDSAESHVDTSGCSGIEGSESAGPVTVHAVRPPKTSCWNIDSSGLTVSYAWYQQNDATPEKSNIGFWTAINGSGVYDKATSYRCDDAPYGGYGHDTSGDRTYLCTASKTFSFGAYPDLRTSAYDDGGARTSWEVAVAVSLDDDGHWDSLNGANYRVRF